MVSTEPQYLYFACNDAKPFITDTVTNIAYTH